MVKALHQTSNSDSQNVNSIITSHIKHPPYTPSIEEHPSLHAPQSDSTLPTSRNDTDAKAKQIEIANLAGIHATNVANVKEVAPINCILVTHENRMKCFLNQYFTQTIKLGKFHGGIVFLLKKVENSICITREYDSIYTPTDFFTPLKIMNTPKLFTDNTSNINIYIIISCDKAPGSDSLSEKGKLEAMETATFITTIFSETNKIHYLFTAREKRTLETLELVLTDNLIFLYYPYISATINDNLSVHVVACCHDLNVSNHTHNYIDKRVTDVSCDKTDPIISSNLSCKINGDYCKNLKKYDKIKILWDEYYDFYKRESMKKLLRRRKNCKETNFIKLMCDIINKFLTTELKNDLKIPPKSYHNVELNRKSAIINKSLTTELKNDLKIHPKPYDNVKLNRERANIKKYLKYKYKYLQLKSKLSMTR